MNFAKSAIPFLAGLILGGTLATPAAAEEPKKLREEASRSAADAPTAAKSEAWPWRFIVVGYGWLPKAPANIKVDHENENVPEKFNKIFDDLQLAAMFEVEVHKGPIGVFASPVFYKGEDHEHFSGLLGERRKVTLDETVWLVKYGVSYDFGPWNRKENSVTPAVVVQPYVGGLYFHDDIELKVNPGAFDIGLDFKTTLSFNTPIVGMNTLWYLTKRWTLRVGGNYGGWDIDNVNETYEFDGTVGYHFKMWDVASKVFAGYRYLYIDYKREVEIQVDVRGPIFGIGWEF